MLAAATREYDQQTRLTALAVNQALRLQGRGAVAVARSIQQYQAAAVALSMESLGAILSEQGIAAEADVDLVPASILTGVAPTAGMLASTESPAGFTRLVETLVRDASRTARAVSQATRPAVSGYVRSLSPPSCPRCAILAGRVYRYSEGFRRHPGCDCLMTPTNQTIGPTLVTDPQAAFENGQIRGMSKADAEAVRAGAALDQVVNVRRRAAGLTVGSSVMERAGRLTPEGVFRLTDNREQQIALLRRFGYVT